MQIALYQYIYFIGAATKCWTCSSDLDPQCADHFNSTEPGFNLHHTLTDCNTHTGPYGYPLNKGLSVCKKQKQIGKYKAIISSDVNAKVQQL